MRRRYIRIALFCGTSTLALTRSLGHRIKEERDARAAALGKVYGSEAA